MKIPENLDFDKRVVDRIVRINPAHRAKIKEYREKSKDTSDNAETLPIRELFPKKKQKRDK
ncbi:MAG: hypothetical protein N3B13_10715 [Deltaproteobacteria bacterium]|nr:hypothetical protein [Deltaproteobacteria bacterium]